MTLKFGEIRSWTTELAALERLKKSHTFNGEMASSHFLWYFNWILFIIARNEGMHRAWMSSKFGQIRPLVSMATDSVII